MADVAALGLKADSRSLSVAIQVLSDLAKAANEAEKAADGLAGKSVKAGRDVAAEGKAAQVAANQNRQLGDRATGAAGGVDRLGQRASATHGALVRFASIAGTIVGTLAAGLSAGAYARTADAWSDMSSKVGAAIKNMDAAPEMMMRVAEIANASYSPLNQTADVYARNVGVLRDLGISASGAADFTEALNHALVVTATKGEQAASVQNALSKAMATGKLQADGLETVLANGGRVAEALAEKLGTTVSGLRNMASQGKITGAVIAGALIGSLEKLRDEAGAMPATIADGFTRIQTGLTVLIGVFDKITGASGNFASVLVTIGDLLLQAGVWMSQNSETILQTMNMAIAAVVGLATAYTATLIPSIYAATTAIAAQVGAFILLNGGVMGAVAALVAFRGALLLTGIGALVVIVGTLVYQFLELARKVGGFGTALSLVKDLGIEVFDRIISGAKALGNTMAGVAQTINAAFLQAFASIGAAWDVVANGIASTWNAIAETGIGESIGLGVLPKSNIGGLAAGAAASEWGKAKGSFGAAATNLADATAPLQSLKAMQDAIAAAESETETLKTTVTDTTTGLTNMGDAGANAGKKTKDAITDLQKATDDFKGTLSSAFTGLVTGAMSLRDAVGNVIGKLAEMAAMKAFETLWGGGLGGATGSFLGAFLGFSHGAAFAGGKVTPFATGGVVSQPTFFPMANGAGLMGEAGPEAIMPLKRGADGKLGVTMNRSGGASGGGKISIGIGFDASMDAFRATVRDETGQIVAEGIQSATAGIVRQSVGATDRAMRKTKAFGGGI